jgi:hypothetical protein
MGKVLWHVTMSLGGFIAGPDDAMDWVFEYPGPNATAAEVIETTGALVVGRRTYEVEDRQRGGFCGGAWTGPFFVLTHHPPADVPDWMTGTFVTDGIDDAIARAKAAAGERTSSFSAPTSPDSASSTGCSTRSSSTSRPCCSARASGSSPSQAADGSTWRGPASPSRGN